MEKIIEISGAGKKSWIGGAWTIAFVYSKYHGNFILKGFYKEVVEQLSKNYTHWFANLTLWRAGKGREVWDFWKGDVIISSPRRRPRIINTFHSNFGLKLRDYKWKFRNIPTKKELKFKRLPKRWIPEFDEL